MNNQTKKLKILERIVNLPEDTYWQVLEEALSEIESKRALSLEDKIAKYTTKIEDKLDIEALVKEQNYKGYDSEKAKKIAEKMNVTESIEELLSIN